MSAHRVKRRSGALRRDKALSMGMVAVAVLALTAVALSAYHHRDQLPRWPEAGLAPVQRVVVEGAFDRVSTTEVEDAVMPYLEGGFFTVNLTAIREAAEALPWVRSAQTMREWPDRVRILVIEEVPAWRWGEHGLLNTEGDLFTTSATDMPDGLPRLDGVSGMERDLAYAWVELDERFRRCAGRGVAGLEADARRALRVTLDDGLVLRLGRTDTGARVKRFCDVVVPVIGSSPDRVAYVDMRYTNGFAVGSRKGG